MTSKPTFEKEMRQLSQFMNTEISNITENFELSRYSWLRSLVVCRLTLFNGRRGEEPSRMLVSEFEDALDRAWLAHDSIDIINDEAEKYLVGKFELAYLHGKGKKYVPVLIPNDIISAIKLLQEYRLQHSIPSTSKFLFSTRSSASHCSGWHAVNDVCCHAGLSINATKNRHYLSTVYASLEWSPCDQQVFLDHMGHAAGINKDNFQCLAGLREIKVMGKMLDHVDTGKT